MTGAELLHASRREQVLYQDLCTVYTGIQAALADEASPVDPAWLAGEHARAETIAAGLRALAAALAPHRLTGDAVPAAVREAWRASAHAAAAAAIANRELAALARARQAAVAARLAGTAGHRRGLAAYRPPTCDRVRFADERA